MSDHALACSDGGDEAGGGLGGDGGDRTSGDALGGEGSDALGGDGTGGEQGGRIGDRSKSKTPGRGPRLPSYSLACRQRGGGQHWSRPELASREQSLRVAGKCSKEARAAHSRYKSGMGNDRYELGTQPRNSGRRKGD